MEPTKTLKQAVKDYRAGKAEAFTQLYEESSRYIYTCIRKVMGGNDNATDAACDIMQDTYVEISKSISQLENENSFLTWAGTIATRKCYAWLKKNKKYVLMDEEDNTFENLADNDDIIPEAVMQDKEKQRIIREIIDTELSEMQRLCIVAYYYNEQKQSEIAQELGIPENTVKTNLSRAKAKIKAGVLDVEEKQGTRLYSVAPLMLLFFEEEASACVVPASVTAGVKGAVSMAGKAGAKTVLGKVAAASAKAKVTIGVIGAVAVVAVGSIAYVAIQDKEDATEAMAGQVEASNEAETGDAETVDKADAEVPETTITPEPTTEPEMAEDITDGNIVIYGGEKREQEYVPLVPDSIEEVNFVIENVQTQMPLYSEDGRLCGHLNQGGSIVVTEHCSPATAWYRFKNPIADTEYEYLYVINSSLAMAFDAKAYKTYMEERLTKHYKGMEILEEKDSAMDCFEFKVKREDSFLSDVIYLYCSDDFRPQMYKYHYIECEIDGGDFDCKGYYASILSTEDTENGSVGSNPVTETAPVEVPPTQVPVEPPVAQNPVETPVPETPKVDKYTPEEAIAVYRSIMEGAGITWNPEIKEFASWGTGFIELKVGGPEWSGNQSVEAFARGDTVGHAWTQYYLEVTGYDENYVYYTKWSCS